LKVALTAIEDLAQSGYLHEDIAWRHVALLPIFQSNQLVSLRPIFIDLTSVRRVESHENAKDLMLTQLKEICGEYDIKFDGNADVPSN